MVEAVEEVAVFETVALLRAAIVISHGDVEDVHERIGVRWFG
jgi:hypothetical protein